MKAFIYDEVNNIEMIYDEIDFKSIIKIFNNLSDYRYSEIKLFENIPSNFTLSFVYVNIEKWKIDYPIELNKIHKQCYVTKQQCLYFLKKIYQEKDIDQDDGFIEVPVLHFTLDEMLAFKKEDEMMLRGENPYKESLSKQEENGEVNGSEKEQEEITFKKEKSFLSDTEIPEESSKVQQKKYLGNTKTANTISAKKSVIKPIMDETSLISLRPKKKALTTKVNQNKPEVIDKKKKITYLESKGQLPPKEETIPKPTGAKSKPKSTLLRPKKRIVNTTTAKPKKETITPVPKREGDAGDDFLLEI